MKDKLKSWLEKTGYPLELYAHKAVLSHGYICEKSQIYTDIQTGTAREIDLAASLNVNHGTKNYFYEVQLLIECKKSEKPLIVLSSGNDEKERFQHYLGHETLSPNPHMNNGAAYFNLTDLDAHVREEKIGRFAEPVYSGYSIVQGFGKSDENIYKGIMGLTKANEHFRSEYHDLLNATKEEEHWFRMQIPILLVDSPLFQVRLDNNGEININESEWSSLLIRVPLVNAHSDRLCNIQVVQKDYFNNFLEDVGKFHSYLLEEDCVYFQNK